MSEYHKILLRQYKLQSLGVTIPDVYKSMLTISIPGFDEWFVGGEFYEMSEADKNYVLVSKGLPKIIYFNRHKELSYIKYQSNRYYFSSDLSNELREIHRCMCNVLKDCYNKEVMSKEDFHDFLICYANLDAETPGFEYHLDSYVTSYLEASYNNKKRRDDIEAI